MIFPQTDTLDVPPYGTPIHLKLELFCISLAAHQIRWAVLTIWEVDRKFDNFRG